VAGTEINVPAGIVTPLENVNGRNERRLTATGKEVKSESESRVWDVRREMQRTGSDTIKPLGLPDEAVYLEHLVCRSFRPALFTDHCVDLFAKGSDVFRMVKKTV
jgi:hypothetical protein